MKHFLACLVPAQQRWLQALAAERAGGAQAVQAATGRIADTADRIRIEQALLAVGVAGVLSVSTWQLGVHLRRRLRLAKQAAQRVAAGDLATPIEDSARDELSILIGALRDMQGSPHAPANRAAASPWWPPQIDETTQANAALVEQSAAAAQGLRQQAAALARAVAVLRLA